MNPQLTHFIAEWWVSYLVVGVTALLGGVLAAHNPSRASTRWVYGTSFVILFAIGFVVTKAQHDQSILDSREARTDERKGIREEIEAAVRPYQERIDELRKQLEDQSKDVRIIRGSNIVTGNRPVPVEVTNNSRQSLRSLSDEDQQMLIETLKESSGSRVYIAAIGSVPEPHIFAQRVSDAFTTAGWIVSRGSWGQTSTTIAVTVGNRPSVIATSPHGLCAISPNTKSKDAMVAAEAFSNINMKLPITENGCSAPASVPKDILVIVIAPEANN